LLVAKSCDVSRQHGKRLSPRLEKRLNAKDLVGLAFCSPLLAVAVGGLTLAIAAIYKKGWR